MQVPSNQVVCLQLHFATHHVKCTLAEHDAQQVVLKRSRQPSSGQEFGKGRVCTLKNTHYDDYPRACWVLIILVPSYILLSSSALKDRGHSLFTSAFLPITLVGVCCEGTLSFVVVLCYRRLEVDAREKAVI